MPPPPNDVPRIGAVEGGGSKFVCAVGRGPDRVDASTRIETRDPHGTLDQVTAFLSSWDVAAVGVAMFGPLELRGAGAGTTLRTPKPAWNSVPVRARLAEALGVPVRVDTDVGAAALAEQRAGAAQGCDPVLYVTVGTGIGGGLAVHGRPLHGLLHPEMGHIPMPRLQDDAGEADPFEGACPFHGRCLEGLASAGAITRRLDVTSARAVTPDHPVWELVAGYLAHGLAAAVLIASPQRIVVGGGVMDQPGLLARVRRRLTDTIAGYLARDELGAHIDHYVVPPHFRDSGLAGAFVLTEDLVAPADPV